MLRSYCVEHGSDWEQGLPWLLVGIREVVQESLGYSPNELVFGHEVRGPIAVFADNWVPPESSNVLDYVSGFQYRLYEACAIAQRKLGKAQRKMEHLFNKRALSRNFQVGDQVLALLPLVNSPFQARFAGPYCLLPFSCGHRRTIKQL